MGLTAAYHNALKNGKPTELEFKSLVENNNNLKTAVEDKVKSLIGDNTNVDKVTLTKVDSSSFEKYAEQMSQEDKNKLISKFQDALKSVYDDFVNALNGPDNAEETPTVDSETVNDTATGTTRFVAENRAFNEKALEYAKLDDQVLASKLNEANSALAGLISSEESLEESLNNGTISQEDYEKAIVSISEQEQNYQIEIDVIEAAKVYKQEAKIIEKMTPEQKAEFEAVNKEMNTVEEKMDELFDKYADAVAKLLQDDISQKDYDSIKAECDELLNKHNNLRLEKFLPLQEKRQALLDAVQNGASTDETPEVSATPTTTTGTISSSDEPVTTEGAKHKTLSAMIAENAKNNLMLGLQSASPITTTSKNTKTDKKDTTTKSTNNIFTKVASGVKSDDLDGVLDAMNKKGVRKTFTNASKVGDQAGVDFTRRQFLKALDE